MISRECLTIQKNSNANQIDVFQHSGHVFKPLDDVYGEHSRKVKEQLNHLTRRHIELISMVQDVVSDAVNSSGTLSCYVC